MKRFAILLALLILQAPITASAAAANNNYNKKPAQKTQNVSKQTPAKQQAAPAKNDEYLLKYNINDLEAAPWLNGGKRKI